MKLSTPIEKIPRIGPEYRKRLTKMGIRTVGELLFHLPHRYEDFSKTKEISSLKAGENATIRGRVRAVEKGRTSRKNISYTQVIIEDSSSPISAIWFNQPYLARSIKKGESLIVSGKTSYGNQGLQFINPSFEKEEKKERIHTGKLVSVYPETEGLSSKWLRFIIREVVKEIDSLIKETLPKEIIEENDLLPLKNALEQIHFPSSKKIAKKARERLSFERIFFLQLSFLKKRMELSKEKAIPIETDIDLIKRFLSTLPFSLTNAQKKASWQILKDLERSRPMNRLLEGDVGSGKTIVAALAALLSIKKGYQVAFMAPTEILAEQHFKEISKLFRDFQVEIGFLTGKKDKFRSKKLKNEFIEISRKKLMEKVEKGEMDILIGTHALIQDKVKFEKLALVIVDEQHRFGVEQRAKLCKEKGVIPHLLSMTATPIPRTLALTLYGDLDISIIDELPKGRKKIETKVIKEKERKETYAFVKEEIKKGRQAFVICPRIETPEEDKKDSVWADLKAVTKEKERLEKEIFPEFKIEMIHGKMTPTEKGKIMEDFKLGKTDILVSTSVLEVGIDVPNVSVVIIEGAEMFGLAQLHQIRGRVGRGEHQSYCFLFTDSKSQKTRNRLKALTTSENGFELSEKDLELRGPGDLSGKRQWGIADFTMEALKDIRLVEKTRNTAKDILRKDPSLKDYPLVKKKLGSVENKFHLE